MNRKRRIAPLLLAALVLALGVLAGCAAQGSPEEITSVQQLNRAGCRIGVAADTAEDRLVARELPLAQIEYFKDDMAAYTSVQQGRLDAFVFNRLAMESAIYHGMKGVHLLEGSIGEGNVGAVALSPVTKIPELESKVNAFIAEIKADGTLEEVAQRWLVQREETMPEIPVPTASDVHLVVGTTGTNMPYTYYVGTELAGYDIELARRFAVWLGATLEFKVYNYDGIIAAAQSGDVDCIFANLFITPERAEALRFSDPTYVGEIGVMVRDASAPGQSGASSASTGETPSGAITSFADLEHARIGVYTGSVQALQVEERFPEAELYYFSTEADLLNALRTGKIDAFSTAEAMVRYMMTESSDLACLEETLGEGMQLGAVFPKTDSGQALCDEFSAFVREIRTNGVYDDILDTWFGPDDAKRVVPELYELPATRGTLRMAADTSLVPLVFIKDGKPVGVDVDTAVRFCKAYGYALEIVPMDFAAIIPAVVTGKVDFACSAIAYTPERAESVLFSETYYESHSVVAVLRERAGSKPESAAPETLEDLQHARIGVLTGSNLSDILQTYLPGATVLYFNTTADEVNALKSGKADALAVDEPAGRNMQAEDSELALFPQQLGTMDYAFAMAKTESGQLLCDQLSEYLRALKADGTLEALQKKWFDSPDLTVLDSPEYRDLPAVNGTVRLATLQYPPFVLLVEKKYVGYEMELLAGFCREQGYALTVTETNMDGLLPSVQSGKCDIVCGSISITEERKELLLFSEPDYTGGTALLVKNTAASSGGSFLSSLRESFEKTFLREDRWLLFLAGIGTTLLITVLSILFGTALGFGVYMACRKGNPVANAVTRFFVWLIQGMPAVVLLMILYYIIFGGLSISGTAVSVLGFTLVFAAAVYGMVKAGVGAVPPGQLEAAYALGYTDRKAFFRIILPQALPHFMPAYKGEITAIIKATAIVGYVAVQDLTKMGDIVRSRTYDAFFPLIAVAVIYFLLAAALTAIVKRVELRIDPRLRKPEEIRKEVEKP